MGIGKPAAHAMSGSNRVSGPFLCIGKSAAHAGLGCGSNEADFSHNSSVLIYH